MERVSVNCFGIGGSNAHAVLDSRRSFCTNGKNECTTRQRRSGPRLLVVSARSPESLQQRIHEITAYANSNSDTLHDLAFTLSTRREHLKHRAFAIAVPNKPLDETKFQAGQVKNSKQIFVFTGQGAQWAGMGRDLIQQFEGFRRDIEKLDSELKRLPDPPSWTLMGE